KRSAKSSRTRASPSRSMVHRASGGAVGSSTGNLSALQAGVGGKAWRSPRRRSCLLRLCAMARPPLTLAALATAAVPGLEVRRARAHTRRSHGAYDSVELETVDGRRLVIRMPRSQAAESEQSADLVAIR